MKIVNSDYWMNQTYIFVPENGDSFNDTLHSLHGGKWIPILFLLNKNDIASNTVVNFQVMRKLIQYFFDRDHSLEIKLFLGFSILSYTPPK